MKAKRFLLQLVLASGDILALWAAIYCSTSLVQWQWGHNVFAYYTGPTVFTIGLTLIAFYIFNLYDLELARKREESWPRILCGILIANVGLGFLFYVLDHWFFPRPLFGIYAVLSLTFVLGIRFAFAWVLPVTLSNINVLVVGADSSGEAAISVLQQTGVLCPVGIVDDDPAMQGHSVHDVPVVGTTENLINLAARFGAGKAILTSKAVEGPTTTVGHLLAARLAGVEIVELASMYEELFQRIPVAHIQDRWLLLERGFQLQSRIVVQRTKRCVDVATALFILILGLPLGLVVAVAIRLDSPGPIFFRQKRVGRNNKEFVVHKFRSMRVDAEKNGAVWAMKHDPRVTKVGRWLRTWRIDELPQLWNVVKGEMSLIGPRPERMEFVRELENRLPYYYIRHTIQPGITGWAQINYPYGASVEDALAKLEYDLYYIKNMSSFLDTKIFLKTIGVMLFGQGAR